MVRDDPFARANVPSRVAIAQQRLHALHAPEQKPNRHQECEARQRRQPADRELGASVFHRSITPSRNSLPASAPQPPECGREKRGNPCSSRATPPSGFPACPSPASRFPDSEYISVQIRDLPAIRSLPSQSGPSPALESA